MIDKDTLTRWFQYPTYTTSSSFTGFTSTLDQTPDSDISWRNPNQVTTAWGPGIAVIDNQEEGMPAWMPSYYSNGIGMQYDPADGRFHFKPIPIAKLDLTEDEALDASGFDDMYDEVDDEH